MSTGPITPMDPAKVERTEQEAVSHGYFVRNALELDKWGAAALGDKNSDETISSWAARIAVTGTPGTFEHGLAVHLCEFLNHFDADHGAAAEVGDIARAEQTIAVEEATPTVQAEDVK